MSPTAVYLGFGDVPRIGHNLTFYNADTLALDGSAKLVSVNPISSDEVTAGFRAALVSRALLDWGIVPVLVNLSRPVVMSGELDIADNQQVEPLLVVYCGSLWHAACSGGCRDDGRALL